jgi:excinuclease ABC subunit C
MRRALNVVKRIFTVRSCRYDMPREMPERACLDFFIGAAGALRRAADAGVVPLMIDEVVAFPGRARRRSGAPRATRMLEASERLDFERAAELRDALRHLEKMEEPTVVLEVEGGDRDVVGYARDGEDACVVLRIRGGKLLAREHRLLEHAEGGRTARCSPHVLLQWYLNGAGTRARELLLPFDFEQELVEEALEGTHGAGAAARAARELVDLAEQNARHLLEEFKLAGEEADERAATRVRTAARARAAARSAFVGLLRHLALAGQGHRGVQRVVRERSGEAQRVPEVQDPRHRRY